MRLRQGLFWPASSTPIAPNFTLNNNASCVHTMAEIRFYVPSGIFSLGISREGKEKKNIFYCFHSSTFAGDRRVNFYVLWKFICGFRELLLFCLSSSSSWTCNNIFSSKNNIFSMWFSATKGLDSENQHGRHSSSWLLSTSLALKANDESVPCAWVQFCLCVRHLVNRENRRIFSRSVCFCSFTCLWIKIG